MIDYYLRFTDEAEATATLDGIEAAIDTIGTIYMPGMKLDADGNPIMEALNGWHVNVRSQEPIEALEPFAVQVNTPIRVWA